MNDYSIRQQNRMINATAFLKKYQDDSPANSRPTDGLVRLPEIVARLTEVGAEQGGGERHQKGGTATKSAILSEVRADYAKDVSRTAKPIAKETDDPTFAKNWRPPLQAPPSG